MRQVVGVMISIQSGLSTSSTVGPAAATLEVMPLLFLCMSGKPAKLANRLIPLDCLSTIGCLLTPRNERSTLRTVNRIVSDITDKLE